MISLLCRYIRIASQKYLTFQHSLILAQYPAMFQSLDILFIGWLAHAVFVDGRPIKFCGFLTPFWSGHIICSATETWQLVRPRFMSAS